MSAPIYGHFLTVDDLGRFQVTEPRGGGPIIGDQPSIADMRLSNGAVFVAVAFVEDGRFITAMHLPRAWILLHPDSEVGEVSTDVVPGLLTLAERTAIRSARLGPTDVAEAFERSDYDRIASARRRAYKGPAIRLTVLGEDVEVGRLLHVREIPGTPLVIKVRRHLSADLAIVKIFEHEELRATHILKPGQFVGGIEGTPNGVAVHHLGAVAAVSPTTPTRPSAATPNPPKWSGISVKVTDSQQHTTYLWCDRRDEQFWQEFSDGTSKYKIGLGPASSCEIRCEQVGTGKSKYHHLKNGAVVVFNHFRIEHLGTQPMNGVCSAALGQPMVQQNLGPEQAVGLPTCECGALKAGCAAGMAGHSPWCPARAL